MDREPGVQHRHMRCCSIAGSPFSIRFAGSDAPTIRDANASVSVGCPPPVARTVAARLDAAPNRALLCTDRGLLAWVVRINALLTKGLCIRRWPSPPTVALKSPDDTRIRGRQSARQAISAEV